MRDAQAKDHPPSGELVDGRRRLGHGHGSPSEDRHHARAGVQGDIGPKLAEEHDLAYWNADAVAKGNLAPQLKIENEKEQGQTVNYDELVKSWADANAKS